MKYFGLPLLDDLINPSDCYSGLPPKVMSKNTEIDIESIVFNPVGDYPYRYKKVIVNFPEQNVAGLMWINGNYYRRETIK